MLGKEATAERGCVCVCKNVPKKMKAVLVKAQHNSHLPPFLLALSANSTKATAEMACRDGNALPNCRNYWHICKTAWDLPDSLYELPRARAPARARAQLRLSSRGKKINQRDVEAEPCLFRKNRFCC